MTIIPEIRGLEIYKFKGDMLIYWWIPTEQVQKTLIYNLKKTGHSF